MISAGEAGATGFVSGSGAGSSPGFVTSVSDGLLADSVGFMVSVGMVSVGKMAEKVFKNTKYSIFYRMKKFEIKIRAGFVNF